MTLKRLAAFVAAAVLVIGAVLLRGALDDKSDGSTTASDPSSDGSFQLICSSEFEEVCRGVANDEVSVVVEPAGTTLDRLARAEDDALPDAWLTLDPFPAMLDETRTRGSSPLEAAVRSASVVAVTTSSIAVVATKSAELNTQCVQDSFATCVGRIAGQRWADVGTGQITDGQVEPGLEDPATEAVGLISFANGVAGLARTTELDAGRLSATDIRTWVRNVGTNSLVLGASANPLITLITRPSQVDVAFTTSAEVADNPSGTRTPYEVLPVDPAFPVKAVFAAVGGDDAGVRSQLAAALESLGWDQTGGAVPDLSASTFINLRTLWKDTR